MKTYDAHIRLVASDDTSLTQRVKSIIGEETRGFSSSNIDNFIKQTVVIPSGVAYSSAFTVNFENLANAGLGKDVAFDYIYSAGSGTPDTIGSDLTSTLSASVGAATILDDSDSSNNVLYLGFSSAFSSFHVEHQTGGGNRYIFAYSSSTVSGVNNFTNFWDSNTPSGSMYDSTSAFSSNGRFILQPPSDWVKTIYPYYGTTPFNASMTSIDAKYWLRIEAVTGVGGVSVSRIMPAQVLKFLLVDSSAPITLKCFHDNSDTSNVSLEVSTVMFRDSSLTQISIDPTITTGTEVVIIGGLGK